MDDGHLRMRSEPGARQKGLGALPPSLSGVRCVACGAHTPVLGGSDPTCLYCGAVVSLPSELQAPAQQLQRNLDQVREDAARLDRELKTEGTGYVYVILAIEAGVALLSFAVWLHLLGGASPTRLQWALIAATAIGPFLLSMIAESLRFDIELRALAKRSFARLVAQPSPTGTQLLLSCSSCGGKLDASQIRGLSIECTHCRNPMLAPSCLADAGQRNFLQRALALRRRLEGKGFSREILCCLIGLFYLGVFAAFLKAPIAENDNLTGWLLATFFFVFTMTPFWIFTHSKSGADFFWYAFFLSALPLACLMFLFFMYLQMTGVTPPPPH